MHVLLWPLMGELNMEPLEPHVPQPFALVELHLGMQDLPCHGRKYDYTVAANVDKQPITNSRGLSCIRSNVTGWGFFNAKQFTRDHRSRLQVSKNAPGSSYGMRYIPERQLCLQYSRIKC